MKKFILLITTGLAATGLIFVLPLASQAQVFYPNRMYPNNNYNYNNPYMNRGITLPSYTGYNASQGVINYQPYVLPNGGVVIPQSSYWTPQTGFQTHGTIALPSIWGYNTIPY